MFERPRAPWTRFDGFLWVTQIIANSFAAETIQTQVIWWLRHHTIALRNYVDTRMLSDWIMRIIDSEIKLKFHWLRRKYTKNKIGQNHSAVGLFSRRCRCHRRVMSNDLVQGQRRFDSIDFMLTHKIDRIETATVARMAQHDAISTQNTLSNDLIWRANNLTLFLRLFAKQNWWMSRVKCVQ